MKKPTCRKCGADHWFFVGCEQADVVNAREERNAAERVRRTVPLRMARDENNRLAPRAEAEFKPVILRHYVQTAPGVFRRRRSAG